MEDVDIPLCSVVRKDYTDYTDSFYRDVIFLGVP